MSALEIARAVVAAADVDAEAVVHSERSGLARFAGSEVHQPTLIENVGVTVRVVLGKRTGVASTNRIDDVGFAEILQRARAAAENAPEDETFPGLATPMEAPAVDGYDDDTAKLGPADQARLAATAIDASEVPAYGFFTSAESELAVANSSGLGVSQRMTDASALVVAAADGCSGYAEQTAWQASAIDPAAVAREASDKAVRTKDARELDPGVYVAVLEPYAVADLLDYFSHDSLGALGLLEKRSYLSDRLGQRIADEKITITDDPLDAHGLPKAFDFEGTPKRPIVLVGDGVARSVVWDRSTAARAGNGASTTGHAGPVESRDWGPLPYSLSVRPGEAESVAELAELVNDGIYVTRLHYLGVIDPREGIVTGMTRDGTFRIRDGKIAEPLVNLRFTVSVPDMLSEVYGLTRRVSLVNSQNFYGDRYPYGVLTPALATARFAITGSGSRPGI